jgi:hypothetical protein
LPIHCPRNQLGIQGRFLCIHFRDCPNLSRSSRLLGWWANQGQETRQTGGPRFRATRFIRFPK